MKFLYKLYYDVQFAVNNDNKREHRLAIRID